MYIFVICVCACVRMCVGVIQNNHSTDLYLNIFVSEAENQQDIFIICCVSMLPFKSPIYLFSI